MIRGCKALSFFYVKSTQLHRPQTQDFGSLLFQLDSRMYLQKPLDKRGANHRDLPVYKTSQVNVTHFITDLRNVLIKLLIFNKFYYKGKFIF